MLSNRAMLGECCCITSSDLNKLPSADLESNSLRGDKESFGPLARHHRSQKQAAHVLATMFLYVFVEAFAGFKAVLVGLTGNFTQQSKFTLWEQTSSDVCHKCDAV